MPGKQTLPAHRRIDLHIPQLVQQRGHRAPVALVQRQIVALGNDQPGLREYRKGAGNRLLDGAAKLGGINDFIIPLPAQALQQRAKTMDIESIRRALAPGTPQTGKFDIGQVITIHRHELRLPGVQGLQTGRQRRFTGPRRSDDAQNGARAAGQECLYSRAGLRESQRRQLMSHRIPPIELRVQALLALRALPMPSAMNWRACLAKSIPSLQRLRHTAKVLDRSWFTTADEKLSKVMTPS